VSVRTTNARLKLLAIGLIVLAIIATGSNIQSARAVGPSPLDQLVWDSYIAQGSWVEAIALDSGSLFVAEGSSYQIQEYSLSNPSSPVASWGEEGSSEETVQFLWPTGIDVDSTGRIVVTDAYNHRVTILNSDGSLDQVIGGPDPGSGSMEFNEPQDVLVGPADAIFVADQRNGRIQVLSSSGAMQTQWALPDPNSGDGILPGPDGMCFDANGDMYVVDAVYSRVYKYTTTGTLLGTISTFNGSDTFQNPQSIAIDELGALYIADTLNDRIIRLKPDGTYLQTIGGYGSGEGELYGPIDLQFADNGDLYVSDYYNDRIQVFDFVPATSDSVPPVTTSNIPGGWTPGPFEVILTAVDESSTIDATYYSTDGNDPTTVYDPMNHFTVSAEGTTTVKYYSVDEASNEETVVVETLRVDSSTPTTVDDHEANYIGSATIKLTASDTYSGVATTYYRLNAGPWLQGTTVMTSSNALHTLQYYSVDVAGNIEPTNQIQFLVEPVDDDPPVTTSNLSENWSTVPLLATLSAVDDVTGVAGTYYSLDGSYPTTPYTGPFAIDWEGQFPVKYYSVDLRGNVETVRTKNVRLDFTKPVTGCDALESYVDSATITLSPSDNLSGILTTQYRVNGGTWQYGTTVSVTSWGQVTLEYRSTDIAGNSETTKVEVFDVLRPDTDPPITGSNIPSGWTTGPFRVELEAFDAISGVAQIDYALDGTTQTVTFSQEETETTYTLDFEVSGEGEHTITYFSTDFRGNVEPLHTDTLRLDLQPPVTTDDHVSNYIESATIRLTPSDNLSGVSATRYRLDENVNWLTGQTVNIYSYGDHTLYYYSVDGAGNAETVHAVDFTIIPPDTTPPVTTSNVPADWVNTSPVTVTLTATDETSPIENTWYSVNGGQTYNVYTGPFQVSTPGITTLKYYSRDTRGNTESPVTAYVKLDTSAPITTSDNGGTYQGNAVINLFPTDTYSGVTQTYWKLDSGSWNTGTQIATSNWGWHTIYYYSVDAAGNTEGVKSETFRIRLVTNTYEQTHEDVVLKNTWVTTPGGSGDSWAYSTHEDGQVHVYFNGERVQWIGELASDFGKADVYLDGVYKGTVDMYSAAMQYNKLLWDSGTIDYEYHYLLIDPTGTKNASSTGYRISADAFKIDGAIAQVPDTAPPSTTDDAPQAWVNNNVMITMTSYDATTGVAATYYTTNGTTPSPASPLYVSPITITAEGTTSLKYYSVDVRGNAEEIHTQQVRIDKTAPVTTSNAAGPYVGSATITLSPTDPLSGVANTSYSLDGGEWTSGTTVTTSQTGTHTVQFRSTDIAGNTETVKSADFVVLQRAEQSDSRIEYQGTWSTGSNINHSGGSWTFTTSTGAAAYVVFSGDRVDLIGARGTNYGMARVTVDGQNPETVDYYSSSFQLNRRLWTRSGFGSGTHVLKIEWLAEKNPASTGYYVGVDAVDTIDGLVADTQAPVTNDDAPTDWVQGPVNVTLTAEDSQTFVEATTYRIDGGEQTSYVAPVQISAEGTTTVEYWSTDAAGNTEQVRSVQVRIDDTAPATISDIDPAWQNGPVTVTLTATDGVLSGVEATSYRIDGGEQQTYSEPFVVSAEGTTTIEYWSTDAAGNTEQVRSEQLFVDDTAPVTSDDAPSGWVNGPVTLTLSASDGVLSGVEATTYRIDGGEQTSYVAPVQISAEGTTTVEYWSTDAAGNTEQVRSVQVRIDDTAPMTSDDVVDLYWGSALITLDAIDPYSGVSATEWLLNGTQAGSGDTVSVTQTGVHTLEYRSVDALGHEEPTATVQFTVANRYEDDAEQLGFTTAWKTAYNDRMSEGSYRWVDSAESYALIEFAGERIVLVATTNSSFGIASVSLDDGEPVDVDLYSPVVGYQQPVWDSGALADGEHTLRIEWTGRNNPASGGTVIGVDALDVAGSLLQVEMERPLQTFEQTDSRVTYGGRWSTSVNSKMSAGSYTFTQAAPGAANVKFSGQSFVLVATTNNSFGIASVSLDGGEPVDVDLYSPVVGYQQRVWESGDLADGEHTVRIEWTGRKNPASGGTVIGVDAVLVAGDLLQADPAEVITEYDQTDRHVVFEGTWPTSTNTNMSGGSYRYTNTAGSSATIEFTGTRFEWVTAKNNTFGQAWVSLDGGVPELVDLYAPSVQYRQTVWSTGKITDGRHTVSITAAGTKNASSTGTYVGVDRLDMVGTIQPVRYDQTQSRVAYDGAWGTSTNSLMSDGSYTYLGGAGAANVTFRGTSIAWVTAKNSSFGIANVYVDGALSAVVDLYSPTVQYQQTVWDSGVLAEGTHTLRIEWTGTKNASSSGTFIGVDALDCAGYFTLRRFEQTDAFVAQEGTWNVGNNTFMSAGNYMWANTAGSTAHITFRGTRFDWVTIKNSGMGIAEVSVDGAAPVEVDLYSPTTQYQVPVWSSGTLTHGTHTVAITWTGRKNASSSGTVVGVDAVDVVGSLVLRRYEQTAPGIAYTSGWLNSNNAMMSGGSYLYAASDNATATITFTGKRFDWITITSPAMGIASVSVDGGPAQLVDLYSPLTRYQQAVWSTGVLTNGPHTITITRTGTKNPSATGFYVGVDAVDVSGVLTP